MFCDIKNELDNPAVLQIMASSVYQASLDRAARKAQAYYEDESKQFYGWVVDDKILGICGFIAYEDKVEVLNIAVVEQSRGRGIGGAMISALWRKYETAMESETDDDAVGFYRKCGFKTSAFQKYGTRRWLCVLPAPKPFDQLSDYERARLFPVILSEYNPAWSQWFEEEKANLERLIGMDNIVRISHYGSTAVPGMLAKPTVDIMLEIHENTDVDKLIGAMPQSEYACLNPPTIRSRPPHLVFLKGYTSTGFAEKVYHIHVRYPNDCDEISFRDHLIANPKIAAEYASLKHRLLNNFEHDRDGYTLAKTDFIRNARIEKYAD